MAHGPLSSTQHWVLRRQARWVGAVLADMHDEWQANERRYLSEGSMAQLNPIRKTESVTAIQAGD